MVGIIPSQFQDDPIANLCFEDALIFGAKKSSSLKSDDIRETSIRFCVDGLRDWYLAYVDEYCKCSVYTAIRDISWHWASFCETDPVLIKACTAFVELRREITKNTAYTDLIERMRQSARIREFGYSSRTSFTVCLPVEVIGVVGRCGSAIGLPFSKFFQVGLGWSLSTNRDGLYSTWVENVFNPLFTSVMAWAEKKVDDLAEVRATLDYRLKNKS